MRYSRRFPAAIPHLRVRSIVLLTRPPLGLAAPYDLHALATPPAFNLSQDQTLQLKSVVPRPLRAPGFVLQRRSLPVQTPRPCPLARGGAGPVRRHPWLVASGIAARRMADPAGNFADIRPLAHRGRRPEVHENARRPGL